MREIILRNTNENRLSLRAEYSYTYSDYLKIYEEMDEEEIYL